MLIFNRLDHHLQFRFTNDLLMDYNEIDNRDFRLNILGFQYLQQQSKYSFKMTECVQQTPLFQTTQSSQPDTTAITIIVLSVILPLQFVCMLGFCLYSKSKTKLNIEPQQNLQRKEGRKNKKEEQQGRQRFNGGNIQLENKSKKQQSRKRDKNLQNDQGNVLTRIFMKIDKSVSNCITPNKLLIISLIIAAFLLAGLITLAISIAASQQALNRQFQQAQCKLNSTVNKFVSGDAGWVGLSYMVPNLTKLQLNLNTRVKATKNSITALVLNGTNTTFPIGFPNGTRIADTITGTNVLTTSIQSFIDVALRQWLFRNSSLSSTYRFPICQTSVLSNIPHPVNDGQTIQLNYMSSICNNLTNEVNSLVANGRAVDQLLVLATSVQNTRPSTNSNLSAYNNSITGISLRSNQYKTDTSSSKIDPTALRALPFILLGLNFIVFLITVPSICYQFCKVKGYASNVYNDNEDNLGIKRSQSHRKKIVELGVDNVSISGQSELSPSEIEVKRHAKIRNMARNGLFPNTTSTHVTNTFFLLVVFTIGLSSIAYTYSINTSKSYCNTFKSAISGQSLQQIPYLSSSQRQLLTPVQKCMSVSLASTPTVGAVNSQDRFLYTSQTPIYLRNIEQLYKLSQMYNQTTPVNVLNSISLGQIQILKNYLLHMETMPIKSPDFTMQQVLSQLNIYTNGTSTSSRQQNECAASVLRDQYVYNVVDCQYTLINYLTENTITQPRCLQIPTWEGSSGTKDADLNDAQHTIQLNLTCPTIYDFFNGTNGACFLGKRLDLLRTANCSQTATEINRRLKNLIKFSVQTASYTNSYLQNLRNYFGVYSVLSTNLTQFFNGANTSAIINQFGTLSDNILNKSSCSYVRSAVNTVYDAYCPQKNSVSMLLFQTYMLILISFGMASAAWGLFILWQVSISVYGKKLALSRPEFIEVKHHASEIQTRQIKGSRNQLKNSKRQQNNQQKGRPAKNYHLQVSQQTLKNEENEEEDKISRLKRLQIIEHNDDEIDQHIDNIQIPQNYRVADNYKKEQLSEQSEHHTEQLQPEYDQEYLHSQQTGKKLLHRQTPLQIIEKPMPPPAAQQNYNNYSKQLKKQLNVNQKSIQSFENTGNESSAHNRYNSKAENTENKQEETTKKKVPVKVYRIESQSSQKEDKPVFFGNPVDFSGQRFDDDSRKDDFISKESEKKNRKVQSKAEVRNYKNQYKAPRSISRLTKEGEQKQRQKAIELDNILKNTIQLMDQRQIQKNDESKVKKKLQYSKE